MHFFRLLRLFSMFKFCDKLIIVGSMTKGLIIGFQDFENGSVRILGEFMQYLVCLCHGYCIMWCL